MLSLCPFRILSSSVMMTCGVVLILHSMTVVKSDKLQIDKYIGNIFRERDTSRYHVEIIGCCLISIIFGIGQSVGSLMYLIHDIKLNEWIWVNFTCIIAYAICLFMVDQPKYMLQIFTEYYFALVTNTFLSTVVLFMGILFKAYCFATR